MTALERWRDSLAAWAIPADVALPGESPWVLPREVFVRRCDRQLERREGASLRLAEEALGRDGGSVLDIGAAAGAASVPLRGVTELTAVDGDAELLAEFARRAAARTVLGHWPEVAPSCPVADVVVCGHVVYNVAELGPFVAALNGHARRLVVVETAERHPLTALNPLWRHFHGIERPAGPNADDFANCLRELGIEPSVERWQRAPAAEHPGFGTLVDVTRRRLCLPPHRLSEVDRALRELGVDPDLPPDLGSSGDGVVTLSWRPPVIH